MPRLLNPKSSECLYTYIGRGILLVVVFFIFSGFLLKMVSVCLIGIYSSSSEERASDKTIVRAGNWLTQSVSIILW